MCSRIFQSKLILVSKCIFKLVEEHVDRGVFENCSKILDRAFLKKSEWLLAFNYFCKKCFIIDVWQGSKTACITEIVFDITIQMRIK